MSIVAEPYIRKNYGGIAIQVTAENMADVAYWCGGRIERPVAKRAFILVPVANSKYMKKNQAHIEDYVFCDEDGFKVFTNKVFNGIYQRWTES